MEERNGMKKINLPRFLTVMTALLPCLMLWGISGVKVHAAAAKETPLVNLAEGLTTVRDSNGQELTDVKLLTDEDKYYLQHDKEGNLVDGSSVNGHQNKNGWEAYVEQGAKVKDGAKYIQLDLGASYPIEVINLKRRMYDGQSNTTMTNGHSNIALRYMDTVIVVGEEENLSDGYVVYYNDEDGSVELPQGVEKPAETASGGLTESMAGTYFYMDYTKENGRGYTDLGTTKQARYIRVYSDDPDADEELMLMELAVYGYRQNAEIQKTVKRKVINNENPLMIAAAYSDDQFYLGQEKQIGLQGWNTIEGRWNTIAEDLKDNTVLMMHSNNLRSFSPHYIGQAYIHGYYEECLEEAYAADVSTMLMLVNASSFPGGSTWCITRDVDYHWVDLMFRMYPNLEGIFSTENFWSGSIPGVAKSVATYLEMADRMGGYVVYSEEGTGIFNQLANNQELRAAVKEHGDSLFYTYKNTEGGNDCLKTQSHIIGSWLAGYTGGWGMLSDSWAWGNSGNGFIYESGQSKWHKKWQPLCAEPETIFGMQMMNTWLSGGVVYTFEFPEVIYGSIDEKSPVFTHVVEPMFRYICENPGPDRAEILNRTETIIYDGVPSSLYASTTGEDNVLGLFHTGRYGSLPSVPTWGSKEEVIQRLKETAKKEGAKAPIVLSNSDGLLVYGAEEYFKSLYPIEYLGDAFAKQYDGKWYLYNSTVNSKVDQKAILPLQAGEETGRFHALLEPHTYAIMSESEDGTMDISLNNYRINAKELIFDNINHWKWDGSSATGQGVSNAKISVYRYTAYFNAVNAKKGVPNLETEDPDDKIDQLSPNDNELRTSTFKISTLSAAPTVELIDGQAPDTDHQPQYEEPLVSYDADAKTATITIKTNGRVKIRVSNLKYEVDPNAIKIEDSEAQEEKPDSVNLAKNASVSVSKATSQDRPKEWVINQNKDINNYTDIGGQNAGPQWVQLDMGAQHDVEKVVLYRYWADARKYYNTVVMLSQDENFSPESTLVLWNGNGSQGGRNNQQVDSWPGKGNGSGEGGSHSLPVGDEPGYSETQEGKTFTVYAPEVSWLSSSKTEELPKNEQGKDRFKARYLRIYMNGNSNNDNRDNHVIEIEVWGESGQMKENVALRSGVSVSSPISSDRSIAAAIDGNKNDANNYMDPGSNTGGPQWVQLDMGAQHDVEKVVLYRYWADARKYYNTVVMLSQDENFSPESTLVLWNANGSQGGKNSQRVENWPGRGNGSKENTHSLPEGTESTYEEKQSGKEFFVYSGSGNTVSWLDPDKTDELPQKTEGKNRFKARYLRVYMNGSDRNSSNHVVEIEAWGEAGEFVLEDTAAPEKVTGIEVDKILATSAEISFLPSMDNMGIKEYRLVLKKASGETVLETGIAQTIYELTGLEANTAYEMTIQAVDNYGNQAEISEVLAFTTKNTSDFIVNTDIGSGRYDTSFEVMLSAGINEGEIFYTIDGSAVFHQDGTPTTSAQKYTPGSKISIDRTCVLQAAMRAYDQTWPTSAYFYIIGEEETMDIESPDAPTSINISEKTANTAKVGWNSSSVDVETFYIYVDGTKRAEVNAKEAVLEATLTDLSPLTAYRVYVTAVDEGGNESLRSETVEFITRKE